MKVTAELSYTWRIERCDPYVAQISVQEGHTCITLGDLIKQVQQCLQGYIDDGWYVVPIEQWTWCCSKAEDGWVMVRYVIAEAASVYQN